MNTDVSHIDIFILDKAFKIACPASEQDNLRRAAQYLDHKMRDIRGSGKVMGIERIAIIAALNISHELLTQQRDSDGPQASASDINALIERLAAAH